MTSEFLPLSATYPTLPPSSNHIYYNRPGGGRALTTAAENWKRRYTGWLSQEFLFSIHTMRAQVDLGHVLCLDIILHLPLKEVVNIGWAQRYKKGKKRGQRKAQDRYKRIDVANRYKLCEDAAADAFGVDDRYNFVVTCGKIVDEDKGVVATIRLEDPRVFGIPAEYLGPE